MIFLSEMGIFFFLSFFSLFFFPVSYHAGTVVKHAVTTRTLVYQCFASCRGTEVLATVAFVCLFVY